MAVCRYLGLLGLWIHASLISLTHAQEVHWYNNAYENGSRVVPLGSTIRLTTSAAIVYAHYNDNQHFPNYPAYQMFSWQANGVTNSTVLTTIDL